MMHIVSGNFKFSKQNKPKPILASALYRPTVILSETQENEELDETNKNESDSAAGDEPKAIDFSIFGDITFLLFFISQGKTLIQFYLLATAKCCESQKTGVQFKLRHLFCWLYGKFTNGCSVCRRRDWC